MNRRAGWVAVRLLLVVGGSILAFALCQTRIREIETAVAAFLVGLVLGEDRVAATPGAILLVVPRQELPFRAIVTPSCSAAASAFTIAWLSFVLPRASRGRRYVATGAAIAVVAVGNILRIAGSVAAGVYAGRASLVLFHDWVGGLLTFGYTLGGYVLMLAILLPGRPKGAGATLAVADAGAGAPATRAGAVPAAARPERAVEVGVGA